MVRLWEKLRIKEVRQWKSTAFRDYNWAARGRSAQDAVWRQSIQCEAAAWRGHEAIADLYDLEKAYEMVPLENVWMAGLKTHFPPDILRLELEAFAAARTAVVNKACAEPVLTLSALVVGASCATDCLFLILADPCDSILLEHPRHEPSCSAPEESYDCCPPRKEVTVSIALYADDLLTLSKGPSHSLHGEVAALRLGVVEKLEQGLAMKLSRCRIAWTLSVSSKSLSLGSSKEARRETAPSSKALGIATEKVCAKIGINFQTGDRLVRAKQAMRIRNIQARMVRFIWLGKTAGPRVFGTGGFPAMRHGAGVVGITQTTMRTINRMTARTFSSNVVGR